MPKTGYVYILMNRGNTTTYIGVTSNLEGRIYEHKTGKYESFSKKYKLIKLVYYEEFSHMLDAIRREKQLKNWHRDWKLNLIKEQNPQLLDLAADWFDDIAETSSIQ